MPILIRACRLEGSGVTLIVASMAPKHWSSSIWVPALGLAVILVAAVLALSGAGNWWILLGGVGGGLFGAGLVIYFSGRRPTR